MGGGGELNLFVEAPVTFTLAQVVAFIYIGEVAASTIL
jgi:hypothetical protein